MTKATNLQLIPLGFTGLKSIADEHSSHRLIFRATEADQRRIGNKGGKTVKNGNEGNGNFLRQRGHGKRVNAVGGDTPIGVGIGLIAVSDLWAEGVDER